MIGRIATFAQTNYLLRQSLSVQGELARAQEQQASGLQAQTYGALSGDVGRLLDFEGQISVLAAQTAAAGRAATQAEQSYSVIGDITEFATSVRATLAAWQGAPGAGGAAQASIQQWRAELQSMLNSEFGGAYLFAGTAADAPAVDLGLLGAPQPASADTSFYVGAPDGRSFNAGGLEIAVSVQANAPAFELLVRGIAVLSAGASAAGIASAFDLIGSAIADLGALQETVSVHAQALSRFNTQSEARLSALTSMAETLKGANLAEATIAVTEYQTQLQASFASLAGLMETSLLDYL